MSIMNAGELVKLAEQETRERCAEIARSFPKLLPLGPKHVRQVTGEDIAEAIEADKPYTPPEVELTSRLSTLNPHGEK